MCGALAITDDTGLLLYGGASGWSGMFKDYKNFHGRMVAQLVSSGDPEVTARVTTLEELKAAPADLFDTTKPGSDPTPLRTVTVDEQVLRQNLLSGETTAWPALKEGPWEGVLTTSIVVDHSGRVRQVGSIVADNPRIAEAAKEFIATMRFKPYLENGTTVQVLSRITMPFKSERPAGTSK
jgi:hypothetical protein